jgi:hypothetical protein
MEIQNLRIGPNGVAVHGFVRDLVGLAGENLPAFLE